MPWATRLAVVVVLAAAGLLRAGGSAPREAVTWGLGLIRAAGPAVFFTAMAVLPAPLFWFTVPAGEAFAAQLTLPGVIAAALAAVAVNIALSYWLAQRVFRPPLTAWLEKRGYRIPQLTRDNAVALALVVRLTPGPPLCLQCYLLALAGMPFRLYLVVSWLLTVPWVVGGVIVGRGVLAGNPLAALTGAGVLGATAAGFHLWRKNGCPAERRDGRGGFFSRHPAESSLHWGLMRPEVPLYTYRCVDRSPLVGPFCRYLVRWFVQWMPPVVPANLLTLGSSGCMWVMLWLATTAADARALAPWYLILMAGYVIYDHADGMHSRRTGTSSPLGEFLDHFTDGFHGSITVVVMFLVAGRADSPLLGPLLWTVTLAGAATMMEERERKQLYFGFIGPLEGMLLTIAYFASWCSGAAAGWWQAPCAAGFTLFEAVMIAGAVGSLLTAASCVRRIGRLPLELVGFGLGGIVVCGLGRWRGVAWWEIALPLTLYGADYTGRVIASHLRGTPAPRPDWVAPMAMVAAAVASLPSPWAAGAVAIYLLGRNVGLVVGFLQEFGGYWRWRNQPGVPLS